MSASSTTLTAAAAVARLLTRFGLTPPPAVTPAYTQGPHTTYIVGVCLDCGCLFTWDGYFVNRMVDMTLSHRDSCTEFDQAGHLTCACHAAPVALSADAPLDGSLLFLHPASDPEQFDDVEAPDAAACRCGDTPDVLLPPPYPPDPQKANAVLSGVWWCAVCAGIPKHITEERATLRSTWTYALAARR